VATICEFHALRSGAPEPSDKPLGRMATCRSGCGNVAGPLPVDPQPPVSPRARLRDAVDERLEPTLSSRLRPSGGLAGPPSKLPLGQCCAESMFPSSGRSRGAARYGAGDRGRVKGPTSAIPGGPHTPPLKADRRIQRDLIGRYSRRRAHREVFTQSRPKGVFGGIYRDEPRSTPQHGYIMWKRAAWLSLTSSVSLRCLSLI
jgi:hypothetical protein